MKKRQKALGLSLLALTPLIIAGFVVGSSAYWFAIDLLMLATCMVGGSLLLRPHGSQPGEKLRVSHR